jgi:hypothetical protein
VCPSCGKLIRPEWSICPFCTKDFDERDWSVVTGGKATAGGKATGTTGKAAATGTASRDATEKIGT